MDGVLGRTAGNALEVAEAIEVLQGAGPADVIELTVALASELLRMSELDIDPAGVLSSGVAMETFERMVTAQGGDLSRGLPMADHRRVITAPDSGVVRIVDAMTIGRAAWRLGAGRSRKEDPVSPTAGVICLVGPGDVVHAGDPILELHGDAESDLDAVESAVANALVFSGAGEGIDNRLIVERIVADGTTSRPNSSAVS